MRVATICPTCATYSNALCTLYNGNTLPNTQILPLDSLQTALIKIDNTFSTNRFNPAANETISGNWSFINGFQVTGEVSFDNGAVTTNGSGSLTAARFIKTGGTSSEVLMADGSTSTLPSGFNPAADETITGDWAFTGDFSVGDSASGTGFAIDRANGVTSIGDWQNGNNGTTITIADEIQLIGITSENGIELNGHQLATQDWVSENASGFDPATPETITADNWTFENNITVGGYNGINSGFQNTTQYTNFGDWNSEGNGTVITVDDGNQIIVISANASLLGSGQDGDDDVIVWGINNEGAVSFDSGNFTSDGSGNVTLTSINSTNWSIDEYGNFNGNANYLGVWYDDGTNLNSGGNVRGIFTPYWGIVQDGAVIFDNGAFTSDGSGNVTLNSISTPNWSIDQYGNFNGNAYYADNAYTANYLGVWFDDGNNLNSDGNPRGILTPNWNIQGNGAVVFDNTAIYSDGSGNVTLNNLTSATIGALNFANDTAAAAGGVPVGGIYNTAGVLKIRLL